MKIELSKLQTNVGQVPGVPENPRFIKTKKYELLKQSLIDDPEFTNLNPILVYDNKKDYVVMGGNMRFKAAQELGWNELEASVMPHNTPPEVMRARIIKHNADYGEDDWDILGNLWSEYPLPDWGLDTPESFGDNEVVEDVAPEVSSDPAISKLGEIYQCGRHRVMCGSAAERDDVDILFGDDKSSIGFTSPPYNVGHNLGYKNDNKYNEYKDDNDDYINLLETFNCNVLDKSTYSFVNLQFLSGNKRQIIQFLYSNMDRFCDIAFWKKSQVAPAMAKNVMNSQMEVVLIFGGNGSRAISTGSFHGNVTNVIETSSASAENENAKIHNATMPVSMASYFIENFTQKGDIIYDSFAGTGTTAISCEQLGRTCYMMELDPKYVDVIRKRYWKFINGTDEGWEENTPAIGV